MIVPITTESVPNCEQCDFLSSYKPDVGIHIGHIHKKAATDEDQSWISEYNNCILFFNLQSEGSGG